MLTKHLKELSLAELISIDGGVQEAAPDSSGGGGGGGASSYGWMNYTTAVAGTILFFGGIFALPTAGSSLGVAVYAASAIAGPTLVGWSWGSAIKP